ncbi:MAG: ATP synthase F0 subunit A [Nitrospiraceae bacterium]|nr:MAG: ATP synthase F0 subunit A [Nitrospiraceae bacterium]
MIAAGIPPFVAFSWVATAIILAVALMVRSSLKLVPAGAQNVVEVVTEFILNLAETSMGHHGRQFLPLLATLFLYILVCNFLGLIPGFEAATGNINTTLSLALPVFFATHYYGLKAHKLGYIKHFVGPVRSIVALPLMILMFIIEMIGHLARPITLSVRLFGNMMAKHILLGVLAMLAPWIIPTLILALGTLVSLIQAFVFVLLTTLYLAGAVEEAH